MVFTSTHFSADIVFKSGIPITMAGLDVTHKALILPDEVEELRRLGGRVPVLVAELIDFYCKTHLGQGFAGSALHDPCAVAWLVRPDIFIAKPFHIEIETQSSLTAGMSLADRRPWTNARPNALVLLDVDRRAFVQMLIDACKSYEK